ncbi:Uncharacterised protein [Mycobacterium tuberculosis]|nr:Uncharacterised protein [Mycobacterium tuberculosis]
MRKSSFIFLFWNTRYATMRMCIACGDETEVLFLEKPEDTSVTTAG